MLMARFFTTSSKAFAVAASMRSGAPLPVCATCSNMVPSSVTKYRPPVVTARDRSSACITMVPSSSSSKVCARRRLAIAIDACSLPASRNTKRWICFSTQSRSGLNSTRTTMATKIEFSHIVLNSPMTCASR